MSVKVIIVCASALLVQTISCQCLGSPFAASLLANPLVGDAALALGGPAAPGGLAVTSSSPIAPTGVTVVSDKLTIEGPLAVGGHLPFKGSVAVDGAVPTGGLGDVSYGCGEGEGLAVAPALALTGPLATPLAPLGLGRAALARNIVV